MKVTAKERVLLQEELGVLRNLNLSVEERLFSLAMIAACATEAGPDGAINADALAESIGIDIEDVRDFIEQSAQRGIASAEYRNDRTASLLD